MDPDGACFLREHGERRFHFGGARHHQVGEFVDHHHDIWQHAALVRAVFEADVRVLRPEERRTVAGLLVEVLDVPRAVRREELIALLHFDHGPLEQRGRITVVGDHLVPLMREHVVHRELDHLRIHHQEPEGLRRMAVDERRDERVDTHRFSRAGCAGDQEVRHLREVGDYRPAFEITTERDRERARRLLIVARFRSCRGS